MRGYRAGESFLNDSCLVSTAYYYQDLLSRYNGTNTHGISLFGKRISGFDAKDAVLSGVETRTSSPVRIPRNDAMISVGNNNIYPCGEGAGFAGGIVSAAVDGIRCAESILRKDEYRKRK